MHFEKCNFEKCIFEKCIFEKCICKNCIFEKCLFEAQVELWQVPCPLRTPGGRRVRAGGTRRGPGRCGTSFRARRQSRRSPRGSPVFACLQLSSVLNFKIAFSLVEMAYNIAYCTGSSSAGQPDHAASCGQPRTGRTGTARRSGRSGRSRSRRTWRNRP